jgi:hypothetical protein
MFHARYDLTEFEMDSWAKAKEPKRYPVVLDCDGMVSIPAIPDARTVPLLLCHERFNEASVPVMGY